METIVPVPSVPPITGSEQPTAPVDLPVPARVIMGWTREYELLKEHPDWWRKTLAVATITQSKILAVHEDRNIAIEMALQSAELIEAARREGMKPGDMATAILIGEALIY